MAIYTIGFTKKTAKDFFEILKENKINIVVDIRLNNTSQLASFAKYPDIEYFLNNLIGCKYIHDLRFAPNETTLKEYKSKSINWIGYVEQFNDTMEERNIDKHISDKYLKYKEQNICLLCSELKHTECHRSLLSERFKDILEKEVINL